MSDQTLPSLTCLVCGDKAFGYNFNVLSCESCKAFFRRNAFKDLRCRFSGNCDVYLKTRNSCRFCRRERCLMAGMKKEWISTAEQRRVRKKIKREKKPKAKIEQDDYRQHEDMYATSFYGDQDYSVDPGYSVIVYAPNVMPVEELEDYRPASVDSTRTPSVASSPMSSPIASPTSTECHSPAPEDSSFQSSDHSLVPISRPITDYRNNFTEVEGNYLTELLSATKILKKPIGTVVSQVTTLSSAYDVLHFARIKHLERLLTAFKGLSVFEGIDKHDRFSIIKPGINRVHHLRDAIGYFKDDQYEYMTVPTDNEMLSTCLVPLDVFRQEKPLLYEAHKNFLEAMANEWDSDYVIIDLLSMISLFQINSNRQEINDPQKIRLKQHIYKYLLQRYLLLKYRTEERAQEKYRRLQTCLELGFILFDRCRENAQQENFCKPECNNQTRRLIESSGLC